MKKIMYFLVTTLIFGLVFTVSVGAKEVDVSDLRLTWVTPNGAHPYWMMVEEGMKAANEDFGVKCVITGPAESELDRQIRALETEIAARVDGIFTCAYVPEAFTPIINKAIKAGIPVVLVDSDAPNSERLGYIGTSNFAAGFEAGKTMVELTDGKAKIGIITGPIGSASLNQRIEGFKEAIKEYPDMEVLILEASEADLLRATEKAQSMLQSFPEMDAIFGVSGNDIVGAGTIVKEKGLAGKITLVGFDDLDQTLDYIREGVVTATTVQKPFDMGYMAVKTLVEINQGNLPEEEIIDTGVTIVTKKNIDTYRK